MLKVTRVTAHWGTLESVAEPLIKKFAPNGGPNGEAGSVEWMSNAFRFDFPTGERLVAVKLHVDFENDPDMEYSFMEDFETSGYLMCVKEEELDALDKVTKYYKIHYTRK